MLREFEGVCESRWFTSPLGLVPSVHKGSISVASTHNQHHICPPTLTLINFIFKLEFVRVTVDLGYDAERIIKNKIYNDFVKRISGTNVLTEV